MHAGDIGGNEREVGGLTRPVGWNVRVRVEDDQARRRQVDVSRDEAFGPFVPDGGIEAVGLGKFAAGDFAGNLILKRVNMAEVWSFADLCFLPR